MKEYSKVHGVFASTNSISHLTKNSISLDPTRDIGKSYIIRALGTYPQGISYLRTLIVEPPFIDFQLLTKKNNYFFILAITFNLQHRADLRPIHHLTIQQSCVFDKHRFPLSVPPTLVLITKINTLYPELLSYFAVP